MKSNDMCKDEKLFSSTIKLAVAYLDGFDEFNFMLLGCDLSASLVTTSHIIS